MKGPLYSYDIPGGEPANSPEDLERLRKRAWDFVAHITGSDKDVVQDNFPEDPEALSTITDALAYLDLHAATSLAPQSNGRPTVGQGKRLKIIYV